jgi:thiamine pyrophosphate-dependent acetolactate synthase large subunit-like protein
VYGRTPDCQSPDVDFANYGRSLGLNAERRDNLAELPAIIERYRGKPLLIDVPIDPDISTVNVRNDVLSADN